MFVWKIFGFIFLVVIQSNPVFSEIIINSLSIKDKNYRQYSQEIKNNQDQWIEMKSKFQTNLIANITPLTTIVYKVKDGDTVFSIASKMGLGVDTLISFNSISNNLAINEGDTILIPNMNGVVIFPAVKTTTARIASIYNVPENLLIYVNSINSGIVSQGEEIFIPFARLSDEEKSYFLAEPFIYPLLGGHFSSPYGSRFHPIKHRWIFHSGVDIGTPIGSNVYASADGVVMYAGIARGYGILVVIRHKFGYTSWYGHLSKPLVKIGQKVSQRDLIAKSGNTGMSTGPHLHFEIRRFNLRTNPMKVLSFNHVSTIIE